MKPRRTIYITATTAVVVLAVLSLWKARINGLDAPMSAITADPAAHNVNNLVNLSYTDLVGDMPAPPKGYVKYANDRFRFYFYYPSGESITEYDERGGAMTVVLEDKERIRGMQIFIVPYIGDKISEDRFKADVPSGIRENVYNTTLGSLKIPAVTFTSSDSLLGDTREIWSIYKGNLYEITTLKDAGDWFTPIIQSWVFK